MGNGVKVAFATIACVIVVKVVGFWFPGTQCLMGVCYQIPSLVTSEMAPDSRKEAE